MMRGTIQMLQTKCTQLVAVVLAIGLLAVEPANTRTRGLSSEPRTESTSNVSVEMTAGPSVDVGSEIAFRISVTKPGYVMLVDIDSEGRMSQLYPRPELLARFNGADINLVRPGNQLVIPTDDQKEQGFKYIVGPPIGSSAVVAILSERRVQLLDLPDLPQETKSHADVINFLSKWMDQLRIPDAGTGELEQTNWSFAIKPYSIQ